MPILNGFEASISIYNKIIKENFSFALLIGYSALLGTNEEEKCRKAGMSDTILKPAVFSEIKMKFLKYLAEISKLHS